MTIIYQKNGLTVKRHNYGWPVGVEYRLTDGVHECSMGSEMPPLNDAFLKQYWSDYLQGRFDSIYCEEEMETAHMVED